MCCETSVRAVALSKPATAFPTSALARISRERAAIKSVCRCNTRNTEDVPAWNCLCSLEILLFRKLTGRLSRAKPRIETPPETAMHSEHRLPPPSPPIAAAPPAVSLAPHLLQLEPLPFGFG